MKPVSLVARDVMNSCGQDAVVLDLFGGSGTTLVACEEVGRRCRMMELDPKYCDVIVKRWENLTSKKAELVQRSELDGQEEGFVVYGSECRGNGD